MDLTFNYIGYCDNCDTETYVTVVDCEEAPGTCPLCAGAVDYETLDEEE